MHRINKTKSAASASSVDGLSSPDQISQLFSVKLQDILNTQESQGRDSMLSFLSATLSATVLYGVTVSEECIDNAFAHLKRGKSDGTSTCSDHLIHALPAVRSSLAFLFTSILRHGYMPESLRNCVLVPIPKANKDPTNSDNYRPISLAPALSKALEWCILLQFPQYFATSGLQFGFKAKMSTTLCSGSVKSVIPHYMHEGSSVFACCLDASKAFDLVCHEMLFNRLLQREFPVHLTRFLLSWSKDQRMSVRWLTSLSVGFPISNAVRQGGVLSPILFTIYIDELLHDLRNLGVGCFWDSHFAGAFGYADDVVLLAPSPAALRLMFRCCEEFASKRSLRFNPTKTQLIRFSRTPSSSCMARFTLCGHQLSFLDTVTHLGHLLHYNLSDVPDVNHKLRDMVKKANCLLASFPRVSPAVLTPFTPDLLSPSLWLCTLVAFLPCPVSH